MLYDTDITGIIAMIHMLYYDTHDIIYEFIIAIIFKITA